ncbi:MAG: hypothetical protein RID53_01330 [Coleofasciculus sp. B1-GNL1-01]|uniref:hypothetical protein n=1 Tax=Coleofasciculus sp. B1-GNL1-01 TaxID=3068484 RepID=UPI0032FB15D5
MIPFREAIASCYISSLNPYTKRMLANDSTIMAQVIQASELTLHDVKEKFNLQQVEDEQFFGEWQGELPELTAAQKEWLDQVKADFLALDNTWRLEIAAIQRMVRLRALTKRLTVTINTVADAAIALIQIGTGVIQIEAQPITASL